MKFKKIVLITGVILINLTIVHPSSAKLRACSGAEKAKLVSYRADSIKISSSIDNEKVNYAKAQIDYQNAIASNASSSAQAAKLNMQKFQLRIDSYNRQLSDIDRKTRAINSVCDSNLKVSAKFKKPNCNDSIKIQLESIRDDYYAYQDEIDQIQIYIKEQQFAYQDALSWGDMSRAARAQFNIRDASLQAQKDLAQKALLQQQFQELNSSCLNSGIGL